MSKTQAILEEHLAWVKQHYAEQLAGNTVDPEGSDQVLREGLILLIDMRFTSPPPQLYQNILDAPLIDVVRWAAMAFKVGGLVKACREILDQP